jgi:hypothetical protein
MYRTFPSPPPESVEGQAVAISEKSRSALYQGLVPIAGEEAVGEMLSYFPARDVEEPVTKQLLRAEIAGLRTEMHQLHNRLLVQLTATIIGTAGIAVTVTVALLR